MKKVFKKLIEWFKGFFVISEINEAIERRQERKKDKIEELRHQVYLNSNKGKRNTWLSKMGYTPDVVRKSTRKNPLRLSIYSQNITIFRALKKAKGIKTYILDGKFIIIDRKENFLIRNKQGIPFFAAKKARELSLS